jgi:predicted nucleic acid-binding protein
MSVFVDTSVWYAAADRSDRSNAAAKRILKAQHDLLTTDHVLVESWLLLCGRLGRASAERFWEKLKGGIATIESVTGADLEAAWGIGQAFRDQSFSIVDRTSFAVMLRLGVHRAASFDDDFAVFRFGPDRKRAFAIER